MRQAIILYITIIVTIYCTTMKSDNVVLQLKIISKITDFPANVDLQL